MRRRYNLNTNRIFESESVYEIGFTFNGKPSTLEEFGVNIAKFPEWEDSYASAQEAMDVAEIAMGKIADALGVDQDDVECVDDDNDWIETFTIDGEGKWVFTVYQNTNECDDMMESKNVSGKRFGRIYENTTQNKKYVFYFDISESVHENFNALIDKFGEISSNINSNCVDVHLFNTHIVSSLYDENVSNVFQILQDVDLFGGSNIKCVYNNIIKNYGYNPNCEFFILTDQDFCLQSQDIIDFHQSNPNVNIKYIIGCIGVKYNGIEEYLERMGINYEILDDNNISNVGESVSARFAKLRKMFESDEDDGNDDNADDNADDNNDNGNDKGDDNADDDGDNSDDKDDDDEEMKAVILTVKKGDAEKCKEELIDANISEDDIEIIEGDDDAENDEVRVDVNSVMELKDYLSKKGIDLEEEIGGEIVSDEEGEENGDKGDNPENDEEDEDFDFSDLGDIFGAEDGEEKSESVKEGLLDFLKKKRQEM